MENLKTLKIVLFTSLLLILSSCGDLFMQGERDKKVTLPQFGNCELDMDAFGKIFEENIKSDLNCLREKLNMFISTVETDRPGYASKEVLKNFLLKGPIDVDPEVVDIVDSVYDLSYLIIGTEKDYIKNDDMDVLIDFLIYFNVHIRETYKYFSSTDEMNYSRLIKERGIIYDEFSLIANRLKTIFKRNGSGQRKIDSEKFLVNFFNKEPETLDKIRSLMFLKRVFLGGERYELTHTEFSSALEILPELAQVAFDVSKSEKYTFRDSQEVMSEIFYNDMELLENVIHFNSDSTESLFTIDDVLTAIDTLNPDLIPMDLNKYPKELMKIKEIFLGVNHEVFFVKELYNLIDHGKKILSEGILGFRIYDYFKDDLNSPQFITRNFEEYPVNTSTEKKYLDNYARIAQKYRFFKGSNRSPFYTFGIYRNPNAFFEIQIIEYFIKNVMNYYGQFNPSARGEYDMTLEQTLDVVKDFKWILKDEGLAVIGRKGGGELQRVADNVVLLSTLFQNQSNGCDEDSVCMEVPEITEFVVGLLTAIGLKDQFTDEMMKLCAADLDEYDRIDPKCFRNNFINVLKTVDEEDGMSLADYMPELSKYLDELVVDIPVGGDIVDSKDYMKFMNETESFTRICMTYDNKPDGEEVFLKADDAFAVFAGLLNVESTMLRWDLDKNGRMDYKNKNGKNEVLNAYYTTYKGAIEGLAKESAGGLGVKLAKRIFQFLIKYGRTPNMKFPHVIKDGVRLLSSKLKKANAHRVTISTILKVVGEENEKKDPRPFKCEECMRDPNVECLPEDDMWND